jgi:hypothetical protein
MKRPSRTKAASDSGDIRFKFATFGPTPEAMATLAQAVTKQKSLQARLAKTRNRLLRIDLVEPPEEIKPARPRPPEQFRAIIYDYTNNVAVIATGSIARPASLDITESAEQPLPSPEEFAEAVRIITADADLGAGLREKRFIPYRPMPP